MKIILSNQCESFSGTISRGTGYYLQARRSRSGSLAFFGVRSRGHVPPDGHWMFILSCARIAKSKLHIEDVCLTATELQEALYEARCFVAAEHVRRTWDHKTFYHADDIINLQITFGL